MTSICHEDEVRAQDCVAQQEAIRTLENRLDNQERMITMLLSYLGHGGSDGNSSAYDEHIPDDVDINKLIKKNGTVDSIHVYILLYLITKQQPATLLIMINYTCDESATAWVTLTMYMDKTM